MPFLGALSRSQRPPEMQCLGASGNTRPDFILGILPDPAAPFDSQNFQVEILSLTTQKSDESDLLTIGLDILAERFGVETWTTPLLDERSVNVANLKAAGFSVKSVSYALHSDMATNRARLKRLMGPVEKWIARRGITLVPYHQVSIKKLEAVHLSNLGEVPEGFFVMTGGLDSEKDYTPSFAAVKDDECIGLIVGAYDSDELFVEAIIVTEPYRGSPLAAVMCGSLAFHPMMNDSTKVGYIVPAAYTRQLEFVRSLGAQEAHDWVKLAKAVT